MRIREANIGDIQQIQVVRLAVTENRLSDLSKVTDALCQEYICHRGKGWVCEMEQTIVGFSIVDLKEHNVWALFVLPQYEKQGIGRKLHDIMLDWYFSQSKNSLWLGTSPGTRAEMFYRHLGWTEVGMHGEDEIKFEMSSTDWKNNITSNWISKQHQ